MPSYPTRKIGNDQVSAIGYGAMGISAFYGPTESDEERLKVSGPPTLPNSRVVLADLMGPRYTYGHTYIDSHCLHSS